MFKVVFINSRNMLYKLDLTSSPSDLFFEKCKSAGYKVLCVIENEIIQIMNPNITARFIQEFNFEPAAEI
jgi:hypothetical protein